MMNSSHSCTTLLPLYRAWGDGIRVAKKNLEAYQQDPTEFYRTSFEEAVRSVPDCKVRFERACHDTVIFDKHRCSVLEGLALGLFVSYASRTPKGELLQNFQRPELNSVNSRVTMLRISRLEYPTVEKLFFLFPIFTHLQTLRLNRNAWLTHLPSLPDTLKILDIDDTNVVKLPTTLPKTLHTLEAQKTQIQELPDFPDSLRYLNIMQTPAASSSAVQTQIEHFKQSHHLYVEYWAMA